MKYFVDIIDRAFLKSNSTNAASKPRMDVEHIACQLGYKPVLLGSYFFKLGMPLSIKEKVDRKLHLLLMWWQARKLSGIRNSDVLLQYPFLSPYMYKIIDRLKAQGNRITILFHDFYTIREHRKDDARELSLLEFADMVIVHTEEMAEEFRRCGCKKDIRLLRFFDYCLDGNVETAETGEVSSAINVLFAGNLSKAEFVHHLNKLSRHDDMHFLLYGKPELTRQEKEANYVYKGCFDSSHPDGIEGNWGLVWDGISVDSCEGELGEYLKINAPFKFSLYLAIGLPVIVWSQSAMARYVREYKVGVCVDSLEDIYTTIKSLTEEEYVSIRRNAALFSHKVRKGEMLSNVLVG